MGKDKKGPPDDPGVTWSERDGSQSVGLSSSWEDILEQPDETETDSVHPFETPNDVRYKRHGLLGTGGMGRVLMALDRRLRREVALKEVNQAGTKIHKANARLAREAWITAQLEHPGIVPVYDSGCSDSGDLFYTMRLIRGRSLKDVLAETETLQARLVQIRTFLDACQAVAYAHSLGIVHRDLKPSNIMIGEFGETQVVDWGLARPSDNKRGKRWREQVLPEPELTQVQQGRIVGTPAYMSPEQAIGEMATEQCDVWGLGAILYGLLTGHPPFQGSNTNSVLQQVRSHSPAPVHTLEPDAPPELVAIAERALCRDRNVRYSDAGALASDLILYLDGRYVSAYVYTPMDHLRRFVVAWRVPLVVLGLSLAVIVLVSIVSIIQISQDRDRARTSESNANAALQQADTNLAHALIRQANMAVNVYARPEAEVLAAHALALRESPVARGVLTTFGNTSHPKLLRTEALPDCARQTLSKDARTLLCVSENTTSMWDLEPLVQRWSKPLDARVAYFSSDGDEVVLSNVDWNNIVFLNASDGSLTEQLSPQGGKYFYAASQNRSDFTFSSSNADIINARLRLVLNRESGATAPLPFCLGGHTMPIAASLSGDRHVVSCGDGKLEIGPRSGPQATIQLELTSEEISSISHILLSDDERWMVLGSLRGVVLLINMETLALVRKGETNMGSIQDISMSADNQFLAIAGERGGVRLWHVPTGTWLGRLPINRARHVQFGDDNLLTVLGDSLQQWRLPAGLIPRRFYSPGGFTSVAFSPDSGLLAGATADGRLRVWSLNPDLDRETWADSWGEVATLQPRLSGVAKDCAFNSDGSLLIGGGLQGAGLQVYNTADWTPRPSLIPDDLSKVHPFIRRVGALQGGLIFGLSYATSGPEVWSSDEGTFLTGLRMPGREFGEAETNHEGSAAVLLDTKGQIYRLTAGEKPKLQAVLLDENARAVDISTSGERVAVVSENRITLYSTANGQETLRIEHDRQPIIDVAFSADGRYIAAGQFGGTTQLWSTGTGELLAVMHGHTERVATVEFSPDGRWLATGSWDGSLQLWGLDVLERPAASLVEELEGIWQMNLEKALSSNIH